MGISESVAVGEVCPPKPLKGLAVLKSTLRCPYCHESCRPHESVACLYCLGRHHLDCWAECRTCASCGADEWLVPETRAAEFRSDQELFALLEAGQRDEVRAYVDRCQAYARETCLRTSDLATQLAFERLADSLGGIPTFEVIGSRQGNRPPSPATRFLGWLANLSARRGRPATT